MVQPSIDGASSSLRIEALDPLVLLRALPQPLHLLELAFGSQHYHFGLFERADESVRAAQDRLSHFAMQRIAGARSVLDIGCGLGGTSRLLARTGARVTAIDPCPDSIAFARQHDPTQRPVRFEACAFEQFDVASRRFEAAIAIEVLQHFPTLDTFLTRCAALVAPGGRLVVHDLAAAVDLDWRRAPFHRRGRLQQQARAAGFELLEQLDLTDGVLPTLDVFARGLATARPAAIELLATPVSGAPRPIEAELDEVLGYLGHLRSALALGDLRYEVTLFQRRA